MSRRTILPMLLGAIALGGCETPAQQPRDRLAAELPQLMDAAGIPGLSIALIEDGQVGWTGAYGVADSRSRQAVTDATIFEAASLSKPVAAYVALRLAARGELDLDEPLWTLLPYERLAGDERARTITPRMVLTHTTGLPNWGGTPLELLRDPGEQWGYSGEGFVYLARAIETMTGTGFDELARREVFEPLGMTSTSFVWRAEYDTLSAVPHDALSEAQTKGKPDTPNAAASLHTTARDYARFVSAVMRGDGLPPDVAARTIEPAVSVGSWGRAPANEHIFWALGWGIQQSERGTAIWHWGDNGTFRCYVVAYPAEGRGVVYFTNSENGLAIADTVASLAVRDTHWAPAVLAYPRFDDPAHAASLRMRRAFLEHDLDSALAVYRAADLTDSAASALALAELGVLAVERGDTAAMELLRRAVRLDSSDDTWGRLAEGATEAGRYEEAIAALDTLRTLRPEWESGIAQRITWLREGIEGRENPVTVTAAQLERYVGTYGPRRIFMRDGALYYRREDREPSRLIPLQRDVFAPEGSNTFRIRFVPDGAGGYAKIVGSYANGRTDETERTGR